MVIEDLDNGGIVGEPTEVAIADEVVPVEDAMVDGLHFQYGDVAVCVRAVPMTENGMCG